jgi:hypothetical protein
MGCMITGNNIDRAVAEALLNRCNIVSAPQRGVYLGIDVKFPDGLIGQCEIISAVTQIPLALASRIRRTDPAVLTWAM